MKRGQKKIMTVADLVYKSNSKKKTGRIDSDTKSKIKKLNDSIEIPFDVSEVEFINHDQKIYDTLLEIKQQGETRKKEPGIFIFNIKEKTILRDIDTRTFEYKFLEKGMNFELVNILINKEGFKQTRHLKEDIGSKSNEAVRKKIGEINEKITKALRLDANVKFIVGEPGAGYKINPNLKIKVIE